VLPTGGYTEPKFEAEMKRIIEIVPEYCYCSGPEQRCFGPLSEDYLFRSGNMRSIFARSVTDWIDQHCLLCILQVL